MAVLVSTPDFEAWLAEHGYDFPDNPATAYLRVAAYCMAREAGLRPIPPREQQENER